MPVSPKAVITDFQIIGNLDSSSYGNVLDQKRKFRLTNTHSASKHRQDPGHLQSGQQRKLLAVVQVHKACSQHRGKVISITGHCYKSVMYGRER